MRIKGRSWGDEPPLRQADPVASFDLECFGGDRGVSRAGTSEEDVADMCQLTRLPFFGGALGDLDEPRV